MKSCAEVELSLRNEMRDMSMEELKRFAFDIGVDHETVNESTREELESNCIAIEQYAFVH